MAEIIVNCVVSKLGNIILNEMQLLGGVGDQVDRIKRELVRIQCCLTDAESKCKEDVRVQNWLDELRNVAHRIEDAIDTFSLRVDDSRPKNAKEKFYQKMHKLWRNPIEMPVLLHNLGTELGQIQQLLEEISKSRIDYGIQEGKRSGDAVILPNRRVAYQQMDENEVVGLDADKKNILKMLRPEETTRRTIVTIVGTGGLGKTTLAQLVYKSARADFEYHVMLSISQQFSVSDLLKKMINKFNINKNEVDDYVDVVKCYLSTRRYLIVLDDVWGVDLWNQLKHALPDVKNGSRILMTSRFINVALSADPTIKPYDSKFLTDKESLELLLKKALPCQETHEKCPSNLLEIAQGLSKKCKGLPLALVVVGGSLSTKNQSYSEWERFLRTMDWHSDGEDCMKVLAMSYQDMPHFLKACFLYLAVFPEDYEISAKRLISMWVAEGCIPQEEKKTIEETAEDCLEELFQRSMVHVSRRCTNGSIKYCRVHDLLRDLAMHKAKEENFVTVFLKKPNANQKKIKDNRRISLQSCGLDFTAHINPKIRSFLSFESRIPKFSNFRFLKVLEIVAPPRGISELLGLEVLIHLKYLGLIDCPEQTQFGGEFNSSVRHLRHLETLYFPKCAIDPEGIWTISTLRHVQCGRLIAPYYSTGHDLRNLQTLKWVNVNYYLQLACLGSLRKLGLRVNDKSDWNIVTNLLKTLPDLVSMGIDVLDMYERPSIPKKIFYPSVLPNYNNLQSLYLNGECSKDVTSVATLFPRNLVKLTLIDSNLRQDPMPELGKLNSLKKLCLRKAYCGDQMICRTGFPVLQNLKVQDDRCKELKIAERVMPKLMYLELSDKCNVQMPANLLLLTTISIKNYN